eukprot:CAMPEP_0185707198 /NCGR_PEP_ID=MMETSP1164-20130828/23573_1 /TAXON_ID=1104430 /ORGANISM="Chrysoreinhardia sp, Strain CCMP2950" /LENGTH=105 /DNA_ID=CAMNT_0028374625 /DNA_START=162 /DNA_END=476 /DNA_ORIENTATION=-
MDVPVVPADGDLCGTTTAGPYHPSVGKGVRSAGLVATLKRNEVCSPANGSPHPNTLAPDTKRPHLGGGLTPPAHHPHHGAPAGAPASAAAGTTVTTTATTTPMTR